MEQVHQCASDATNVDAHSILMPWFTVRKVKVDVEVVSIPLLSLSCFDWPGSLLQK